MGHLGLRGGRDGGNPMTSSPPRIQNSHVLHNRGWSRHEVLHHQDHSWEGEFCPWILFLQRELCPTSRTFPQFGAPLASRLMTNIPRMHAAAHA